jgi:hypothetical protein
MTGFDVQADEYGEPYLVPTSEGETRQRMLRASLSLKSIGISPPPYSLEQYQGEDKMQNIPKLKKYCTEFERYKGTHLYLWSKGNASQKTTVAKNILISIMEKGYTGAFILMADLLHTLQNEQFTEDGADIVQGFRAVDFLVIDDAFDVAKATLYKSGYQLSYLDTFLRYRLETCPKATCFTANIPITEIAKTWTPSIESLVKRSVPTPMAFTDYIDDFDIKAIWG